MIVKSQKRIEFINDCNCIVDYNELEKDLFENASNYVIPKQEIKGKIEELDIAISECIYLDDDDKKYKKAVKKDKLCLLNQKRALQELLEEGDLE